MVSPDCLASTDMCFTRVTQLLDTGHPKAGLFGYKTDSTIQAKIGPTNDTVNEIIRRNGCGQIITHVPQQVSIKGSTVSFDISRFDRDLIWLLTGGTRFVKSGHTIGLRAPFLSDGPSLPVCMEFWSRAWDGTQQATTFESTPNVSYHHWVLPFVRCSIAEFTLANGDTVFTVSGDGSENQQITADGPWNDWPPEVAGAGGFTAAYGEYDDGTIPTAACGLQTVPTTS
jgi:hypothetical protein